MEPTLQQWIDDDVQFMEKYPNGIPLAELIPFYEMIARNEPIKLEWVCPGKYDPSKEETQSSDQDQQVQPSNQTTASTVDSSKLAEFDFDEGSSQPLPLSSAPVGIAAALSAPLRTARHPPRQPRVANMDKILNDLFRSRKDVTGAPNTANESLSSPRTSTGMSNDKNLSSLLSESQLPRQSSQVPSTDQPPCSSISLSESVAQPHVPVVSQEAIAPISCDNNSNMNADPSQNTSEPTVMNESTQNNLSVAFSETHLSSS